MNDCRPMPKGWGHRIRLIVCLPTKSEISSVPFGPGGKLMCSRFGGGFSMSLYVVAGGGGFIGSHIVEELLRRNETVRVIDNFSTGKRENVAPFANRAEVIEADIAEAKNL